MGQPSGPLYFNIPGFTASLTSRIFQSIYRLQITLVRDSTVDATTPDGNRRIQRGANPAIPSLSMKAR